MITIYNFELVYLHKTMDETQNNRDARRCNHAHITVQGCLYSEMNQECINTLIADFDASEDSKLNDYNKKQLLEIAKKSSISSKQLLVKSQTSIGRRACEDYAKKQYKQINKANTIGKDCSNIESISKYIVDKEILDMANNIVKNSKNGKCYYSIIIVC